MFFFYIEEIDSFLLKLDIGGQDLGMEAFNGGMLVFGCEDGGVQATGIVGVSVGRVPLQ